MSSRKMFGTDGVRDLSNRGYMRPETVLRLGLAFGAFLRSRGAERPRVLVGTDTRGSKDMLLCALAAGLASAGVEVVLAGVVPTPGVSAVASRAGFDGGAVISASHNPPEYNGVKFFDSRGFKLSDEEEMEVESLFEGDLEGFRSAPQGVGRVSEDRSLRGLYEGFLMGFASKVDLSGKRVVLDCANGACCEIAPRLFRAMGADLTLIGCDPDGSNINQGVGVTHIEALRSRVLEEKAHFGVAYDGDGDRVLLVDALGRTVDGDLMLYALARLYQKEGRLGSGVVATVMSNMGLEAKLQEEGIKLFRCPVGDRYVVERALEVGSKLGGEQSGHVVALDLSSTGDGMLTAILVLTALKALGIELEDLSDLVPRFHQKLMNFKVEEASLRRSIPSHPALLEEISSWEERFMGRGRIFVRPSGTEPLLRVLIEVEDGGMLEEVASSISHRIRSLVGTA